MAIEALPLVALAVIIAGVLHLVRRRGGVAYGLGLIILVAFGFQVGGNLFLGRDLVGSGLALTGRGLFAGEIWTPFSYMFVHSGLNHLLGNLFILLTVGPILEARIGSLRFLRIYFVAGLAAALAHLALSYGSVVPGVTPFTGAVGASGAIFGVLTAFAVRYPREPIPIPLFFILWLPAFVVLLVYLVMNLAFMFAETNVAWWGHFAGFLVGLAWATRLEGLQPIARRAQGLDVDALAPLATTQQLKGALERLRQFEDGAKTQDDPVFAEAWLDRFFERAQCPHCGSRLVRHGLAADCERGDYRVDFAKRREGRRASS